MELRARERNTACLLLASELARDGAHLSNVTKESTRRHKRSSPIRRERAVGARARPFLPAASESVL